MTVTTGAGVLASRAFFLGNMYPLLYPNSRDTHANMGN